MHDEREVRTAVKSRKLRGSPHAGRSPIPARGPWLASCGPLWVFRNLTARPELATGHRPTWLQWFQKKFSFFSQPAIRSCQTPAESWYFIALKKSPGTAGPCLQAPGLVLRARRRSLTPSPRSCGGEGGVGVPPHTLPPAIDPPPPTPPHRCAGGGERRQRGSLTRPSPAPCAVRSIPWDRRRY
jgi:hypothetical protein